MGHFPFVRGHGQGSKSAFKALLYGPFAHPTTMKSRKIHIYFKQHCHRPRIPSKDNRTCIMIVIGSQTVKGPHVLSSYVSPVQRLSKKRYSGSSFNTHLPRSSEVIEATQSHDSGVVWSSMSRVKTADQIWKASRVD